MSDEYYTLPTIVLVGGKRFSIEPIKIKHIPYVLSAIEPILLLVNGAQTPKTSIELVEGQARVLTALSKVFGVDVEWLEELNLEDLAALLIPFVQVNLDFFIQRVLPRTQALQNMVGRIPS